jgi:hypothetical protein
METLLYSSTNVAVKRLLLRIREVPGARSRKTSWSSKGDNFFHTLNLHHISTLFLSLPPFKSWNKLYRIPYKAWLRTYTTACKWKSLRCENIIYTHSQIYILRMYIIHIAYIAINHILHTHTRIGTCANKTPVESSVNPSLERCP